MVGAGFSRNATPLKPHGLPFPSWKTLIAGIVDALYPSSLTADSERKRAQMLGASPSGMLALAQEYEAAFGRAPLDSFVRSMIPDLDFAPGRLQDATSVSIRLRRDFSHQPRCDCLRRIHAPRQQLGALAFTRLDRISRDR